MSTSNFAIDRRSFLALGCAASALAVAGPLIETSKRQFLVCNLWDENFLPKRLHWDLEEPFGWGTEIKFISMGSLAQEYSAHLSGLPFQYSTRFLDSMEDVLLELSTSHLVFIAADLSILHDRKIAQAIARAANARGILTVTTAIGTSPNPWPSRLGTYLQIPAHNYLDVLGFATSGLSQLINVNSFIGIDFEDIRTVLREPGHAHVCSCQARGSDRGQVAAANAIQALGNQGIELSDATGILVIISGSKNSLRLKESRAAMNLVRGYMDRDAHVIYGIHYDDTLADQIRVTLIPTGLPYKKGLALQRPF